MKTHELKTIAPYYEDVRNKVKTFELRKNDRGFQVGDFLLLREMVGELYSGRQTLAKVKYILEGFSGLESDYCIMQIVALSDIDDIDKARDDNIAIRRGKP